MDSSANPIGTALHRRADTDPVHRWPRATVTVFAGGLPSAGLHSQLPAIPWARIPTVDTQHDRGLGRVENRTLKLTAIDDRGTEIGFPHARLALHLAHHRPP